MHIKIKVPLPLENDVPHKVYRLIVGDTLKIHDAKNQTIFELSYPFESAENCDELLSITLIGA